jgi:hypothetical protein
MHEAFFFKICIFHFQQLTYVQKLSFHCGKCRLSAAKERFSLVDALLKVVNFKRSKNQVAGGALLKIPTFHSYGAVFARSCAVESAYFP